MISLIIPMFNESEIVAILHERLSACVAGWNEEYEIILVDDGSWDNTLQLIEAIASGDRHWKIVALSRNFGHQAAVTAGLEHAQGDLVAVIDADLQDPPEELPRFFAKCREGFDVVYGVRTNRKEGIFKKVCYWLFYRLLGRLTHIDIPLDSGDFCVMNRRVVNALNSLPERSRFIRALRSWTGFKQTGLEYERRARAAGEPKYNFRRLMNLALDGIINFSNKPLRMISVLGMSLAAFSFFAAAFVLIQYAADWTIWGYNPRHARGWTSLMLVMLFLSSVQLFCTGVLGEYVSRIFEEVKNRPVYLVARTINVGTEGAKDDAFPVN